MDVNELARCIMGLFNKINAKVDQVVDQRWLELKFLPSLNPKERGLVKNAIELLISQGFITQANRAGMYCLVLTQKGFESIYNFDKNKILQKIRKGIMAQFARNKSHAGHTLEQGWILSTYMPTLNPVEKDCVNNAISSLVKDGFIIIRNGPTPLLELTPKGFDQIY
jgi:predicted transcriptional regulator